MVLTGGCANIHIDTPCPTHEVQIRYGLIEIISCTDGEAIGREAGIIKELPQPVPQKAPVAPPTEQQK